MSEINQKSEKQQQSIKRLYIKPHTSAHRNEESQGPRQASSERFYIVIRVDFRNVSYQFSPCETQSKHRRRNKKKWCFYYYFILFLYLGNNFHFFFHRSKNDKNRQRITCKNRKCEKRKKRK